MRFTFSSSYVWLIWAVYQRPQSRKKNEWMKKKKKIYNKYNFENNRNCIVCAIYKIFLPLANNFQPKNNKHLPREWQYVYFAIFNRSDQFLPRHSNLLHVRPFYWTICLILLTYLKGNWLSLGKICISKKTGFFSLLCVLFNPFLFVSKGKRLLVCRGFCFVDPISMELQLTALFGFSGFCFCLVLTVDERSA